MSTVPQSDPQRNRRDQLRRLNRLEFIPSPASQEFTAAASARSAFVHVAFAHLVHVAAAAMLSGADQAETRQALDAAYRTLVQIVDSALVNAVGQIHEDDQ